MLDVIVPELRYYATVQMNIGMSAGFGGNGAAPYNAKAPANATLLKRLLFTPSVKPIE
jgi:hypothetical protein